MESRRTGIRAGSDSSSFLILSSLIHRPSLAAHWDRRIGTMINGLILIGRSQTVNLLGSKSLEALRIFAEPAEFGVLAHRRMVSLRDQYLAPY